MFVFGFTGPLKPMARTKSTLYLPENIMFSILLWLPVQSLVRFRSVCKLWLSIISNNLFIQTHLLNSHNKQAFVLKGRALPAAPPMKWMLYYVNPTREEFVRLNLPPECNTSRVCYIQSCNGLVCLAYADCKNIYVVNPSTRRFKRIPSPNIQARFGIRLNFGFDCITNDYKLLRISACDVSVSSFKAELYSANADSWKEVQASDILQNFRIIPTSVMYMERFHKLISRDAVLLLYPFPPYPDLKRRSLLLDFEGSFALIFNNVSVYSLWMLEDVCGKLSWKKKFNLEFDSNIFWVVSYLGDGHFVALVDDDDLDQYVFYDYKKKETKKFLPAASLKDITIVTKYTESLVSLDCFEPWE